MRDDVETWIGWSLLLREIRTTSETSVRELKYNMQGLNTYKE